MQTEEGDPHRQHVLNLELRRLRPDLLAMQEVLPPGNGNSGQLAALLTDTGLQGTHQAEVMTYAPRYVDQYGGNAVATRWPHRVVEVVDPRVAEAPDGPWCTLAALVALPELGNLLFIAATGAWRLDAEVARERQALAVTDLDVRHRDELATVIAGDFNAAPDAASIRFLTGRQSLFGRSVHYLDAWEVVGVGPGYTWTVDNPTARAEIDEVVGQLVHHRRLDYVFVGSRHAHPNSYCHVRAAELVLTRPVEGVMPSDHYGVLVELDVGLRAG